jgi:hypothetical protein
MTPRPSRRAVQRSENVLERFKLGLAALKHLEVNFAPSGMSTDSVEPIECPLIVGIAGHVSAMQLGLQPRVRFYGSSLSEMLNGMVDTIQIDVSHVVSPTCYITGSPKASPVRHGTHCPGGGCQSSTLLPSGSMTQPNFP